MIKHFWILLVLLMVTACAPSEKGNMAVTENGRIVTVFHTPACACCGDWIAYMEDNGFIVEVKDVSNLADIKTEYNIPTQLYSCHTAIVDGYVIEGHVSVAEIDRLLAERPDVAGIAVPGMPPGSPGMEVEGVAAAPYDVFAFDDSGLTTVYASYGQ